MTTTQPTHDHLIRACERADIMVEAIDRLINHWNDVQEPNSQETQALVADLLYEAIAKRHQARRQLRAFDPHGFMPCQYEPFND